ncbi:DUF3240 family protein [Methylomonas rhizoryzae]|uniref:DUF3240 family protein n=1 Tax=Methylomonas sp. HYX-M1 TaxID=3139307 RepID=UPI001232D7F7
MNLFLRRIPANTRHVEISEFVRPALYNGFFKKPSRILNIEILALRDIRYDSIEYHGLVTLDSEWAVGKAINMLRNKRLNGRYVLVRPYFHRSWDNDPRQQLAQTNSDFIEKRHGDRRRGKNLQVIKNVSDRFNTEDDFYNALHHQQYQVTFVVPSLIELAVAECLVNFELEYKQEASVEPVGQEYNIIRFMTELDGPEHQSKRYQLYATRQVISALIEKLKSQFTGHDIHYWVSPVVEFGVI